MILGRLFREKAKLFKEISTLLYKMNIQRRKQLGRYKEWDVKL